MEIPEGVSSTPEGVGLVLPLALLFVLLPSVSERSERVVLGFRGVLKELSVNTGVEDPDRVSFNRRVRYRLNVTYQSQSFLVTSETNQGIFFPWKMISEQVPDWMSQSA